MHPSHVLLVCMRTGHALDDLLQVQWRAILNERVLGGCLQNFQRHQRAGIENNRALLNQPLCLDGN